MSAFLAIRFVTCDDPISAIIRRGELGFWASHVEILTPDNFLFGAHVDGGVVKRGRYYDQGQWTRELFVILPVTDEQETAFWKFATDQIGKPYDLEAIEQMAQGGWTGCASLADNAGASWICSAFVAACLLAAGLICSTPSSLRLTTPRDTLQMLAALVAVSPPHSPDLKLVLDPFAR